MSIVQYRNSKVYIHCTNLFECPLSNIQTAKLTFTVQIYLNVHCPIWNNKVYIHCTNQFECPMCNINLTSLSSLSFVVSFLQAFCVNFTIYYALIRLTLLKTLDTIGNCQRPVFSLGVSQQLHTGKITTNLWKFELDWLLKLRDA